MLPGIGRPAPRGLGCRVPRVPKASRCPGGRHPAVALAEDGPGKPPTQCHSFPVVGAATLSEHRSARWKAGGGQARPGCLHPPGAQQPAQGAARRSRSPRARPDAASHLEEAPEEVHDAEHGGPAEPGPRSPPAGPAAERPNRRSRNASPRPAPALAPGRPTRPASPRPATPGTCGSPGTLLGARPARSRPETRSHRRRRGPGAPGNSPTAPPVGFLRLRGASERSLRRSGRTGAVSFCPDAAQLGVAPSPGPVRHTLVLRLCPHSRAGEASPSA